MSYPTVNSTNEGREDLIVNLGTVSLILLGLQFVLWLIMYESGVDLISWQGVVLAGLLGVWLTITFLCFAFKRGQGTQTTADFGHGVVAVKRGDFWGVFAAEREMFILKFEFTSARVVRRDHYGKPTHLELTNESGLVCLYSLLEWRMLIEAQFKQIIMENDNLCGVQGSDDKWGVWSLKRGRLVMPATHPYYKVWPRCHDFAGVPDKYSEGMKWAIFSFADQRVVTPYTSDGIRYLGNGVFKLQHGHRKLRSENRHLRFGLYLHQPRLTIKPKFTLIKEFEPGLLELQDKWFRGLISTRTGRLVVPVEQCSMKWLSDEHLELTSGSNKRVVNLTDLQTA